MRTHAARKASHEPRRADLADRRPFGWRPREILALLQAAAKEFVQDKSPKQAAALAYYTLFALGPLLVLAIGIAALVFGAEAARGAILGQVGRMLGERGSEGLTALLGGADRERVGVVGTLAGSVVLLISAGAVFAQLKEALNRIWEVEAKPAEGWKAKVWRAVGKNFVSFVGVMGTGFLLLVSLVLSAALAAMGDYFAAALPATELVWQAANFAIAFAIVSLVFAMLFKLLPDARVAWRDVLVGGTVTGLLFVVGQLLLAYYLGAGPLSTRYGPAGAVLVVLVWVYYSSMILFFGAEITQVYANRYGSHVRESRDARPLTRAIQEEQAEPEVEGTREGEERKERPGGRGRPQA